MRKSDGELYKESADYANSYRAEQYEQLLAYVELSRQDADRRRADYFQPDASSISSYEQDIRSYRESFIRMLGRPLHGYEASKDVPDAEIEFVAEDALSRIYRIQIKADERLTVYGLLFLPAGEAPYPLVIAQHGGWGTPEKIAEIYVEAAGSNYNNIVRRILRRGAAVFAPQLLLWRPEQGPEFDRRHLDVELKQVGSSITAVEICKIRRALDYLLARSDIDESRVAMTGLSYGGFYTLVTTAAEERIKVAYSSCYFNNRYVYDWSDYVWFDSAGTFLDAEIAGLICPCPLYIEVGKGDEVFRIEHVGDEAKKAARNYQKLGIRISSVTSSWRANMNLIRKTEGWLFYSVIYEGISIRRLQQD